MIYDSFIASIDAVDNGISQYDTTAQPRYRITTDLSSRINSFRPDWNESDHDLDDRFQAAMNCAGQEFVGAVTRYAKSWLPARNVVIEALNNRFQIDNSGQIVLLERTAPWKDHLETVESELNITPPILFCVFQDSADSSWRIQAVPMHAGSFELRKPLPAAWRGLREADLSKASGVDGCVFVHMNGFIGGNRTREGALQMARIALL
eukprot:c4947_g1_i1.p1 GENE.c4947_g1_i1~~c4947_g1_i1.p1  ORF type:complete len:207 (+),score=66.18 c4947_g1_i1:351-971(+)